jgi:hypothetical protein
MPLVGAVSTAADAEPHWRTVGFECRLLSHRRSSLTHSCSCIVGTKVTNILGQCRVPSGLKAFPEPGRMTACSRRWTFKAKNGGFTRRIKSALRC